MTLTLKDVNDRVRAIYGDKSKTQIDDVDIARWTTDNQRWLVRHYQPESDVQLSSVAGQSKYPVTGGFRFVRSVNYDATDIRPTTRETLNQLDPYWQSTVSIPSGIPEFYWLEANTLRFYPTPDASGKIILIRAVVLPGTLTNLTDPLVIDEAFLDTLVQRVLKNAKEFDEDWNGASYFRQDASAMAAENAAESWDNSGSSYPVIRDVDGDY